MENISVSLSEYPPNRDITLLVIKGLINMATAVDFRNKFLQVLGKTRLKLVVDIGELEYINAAGWGVLFGEIKRIREQKGDLVLAGMNRHVSELFKCLEFDVVFKTFPNVESAIEEGFGKP